MNVFEATSLKTPFRMAIAFTVVVSLRPNSSVYIVLSAVGVLPSRV